MKIEELKMIVREYLYINDMLDAFVLSGQRDPKMKEMLVNRAIRAREAICKASGYGFDTYES